MNAQKVVNISIGVYVGIIIGSIIVDIILGIVCKNIMRNKGRSAGGGFCLGFFLGLIGLIIALCLSDLNTYHHLTPQDEWVCPKCQRINNGGEFCSKCGESRKKYVSGNNAYSTYYHNTQQNVNARRNTSEQKNCDIWACNKCGKVNDGGNVCSRCGTERGKII